MSNISKEDVIKFIENMTVLELSESCQGTGRAVRSECRCADGHGGHAGSGAAEAAPVEEQTEFSVVITGVGDKKIKVIKEVRAITSLGLKEAKDLVEKLPGVVKEGIPKAGSRGDRQTADRSRRHRRNQISSLFLISDHRKSAERHVSCRFPISIF